MMSLPKTLPFVVSLCVLLLSGVVAGSAQSDNLVRNRLKRVALGEADEVRKELPELLSEFPNDAGVRLLHAVLVDDAARALPMFERIVQEYPQSEWADDAQWRVVQIYALRGDTAQAWQELQKYRKQYPDSEFLLFASELIKNTVGAEPPSRHVAVYQSKSSSDKPVTAQQRQPVAVKKPAAEKTPERPAPAEQQSPKDVADKDNDAVGSYVLQVGLYSTRQAAEAEVDKFRHARMRTEIMEKTVGNEKKYAVIIGKYSTREGAEKAKETVEKYCECTPFIVQR